YIIVQMSDGTNKLTAQDVKIDPTLKDLIVDFNDLAPNNGQQALIQDGYNGFDWHSQSAQNMYALNQSNYGGYSLNSTAVALNGF
ncbi:hypothetical protein, partial [Lacticaseibacillus rhamnosus]|uniref:hypothetical protein n=1 Tax=Lacticaseibacillus rhamnosus TaxID=47715 RepID=UPI003F44B4DE